MIKNIKAVKKSTNFYTVTAEIITEHATFKVIKEIEAATEEEAVKLCRTVSQWKVINTTKS